MDIAGRINTELKGSEAGEIIKVINSYSNALNLLDDYDHKKITKPNGTKNDKKITYEDCKNVISQLKFGNDSDFFALERDEGLKSILGNIYQSFDGKDFVSNNSRKSRKFLISCY